MPPRLLHRCGSSMEETSRTVGGTSRLAQAKSGYGIGCGNWTCESSACSCSTSLRRTPFWIGLRCQPFWLDWVWRLLNEVDNSLIAFVNWHYYAEWRDYGEGDAAGDARTMQNLLMAQTHQYGLRAAQVTRLLRGRSILHMCGEWNA